MDNKMNETQIKEAIAKMHNTEEYILLRKYYSEDSILKTLGFSREEKAHSNFIAWLLSPESNHELGYLPLRKFLQMLSVVKQKDYNSDAFLPTDFEDSFLIDDFSLAEGTEVKTEVPTGDIAGFDKKGRIDILMHLHFRNSEKILPIILENKVLSTENDEKKNGKKSGQTDKYYDWGKIKYSGTDYEEALYIFLAPDFERDIKCSCEKFIKVSYQNLIDYVIEPCLLSTSNTHAKFLIEDYLRCLSNSTLDNTNSIKEGKIMGFSAKELELLKKFHEKNKDLFDAVLTMLENDEETDAELREKIGAVRKASGRRDYSKYFFDGKEYTKGALLIALIQKYISANPNADAAELKRVFDFKLEFNKRYVILLETETTQKMRDDEKVFAITLPVDGSTIYINKQVQIGDMDNITNIADALKFDVKKIK